MEPYRRWLDRLAPILPPLAELGYALPYMTVPQRKVVLTMSRCQVVPTVASRLYTRNMRNFRSYIRYHSSLGLVRTETVVSLCLSLGPHLSPVVAGLLSVMTRMAPYEDYSSIQKELEEGVKKEMDAAVNRYHPASGSYGAIMDISRKVRRSSRLFPSRCRRVSLEGTIRTVLIDGYLRK